jgi:hypothetical protein
MTAEHLTSVLAERVLQWRVAPDRFLTGKRAWLPRWRSPRFQPIVRQRAGSSTASDAPRPIARRKGRRMAPCDSNCFCIRMECCF